jgi:hypothetical protein
VSTELRLFERRLLSRQSLFTIAFTIAFLCKQEWKNEGTWIEGAPSSGHP